MSEDDRQERPFCRAVTDNDQAREQKLTERSLDETLELFHFRSVSARSKGAVCRFIVGPGRAEVDDYRLFILLPNQPNRARLYRGDEMG